MEEIAGERVGTRKYFHEGYAYHLDVRVGELGLNNIFRCATRTQTQCRGTIRMEGNAIIIVQRHDQHPANLNIVEETRMRSEIFELVRTTMRGFREIYADVAMRYEEHIRSAVTFRSLRSMMERERARARPPAPRNMFELGELLYDYPITRNMFCGVARGGDGVVGLLFATEGMLRRLNSTRQLVINCLFQATPEGMRTLHILVLYTRNAESMKPVMYVIMERVSQVTYTAVWASVFRLAPALRNSLNTIISGFEKELIVSLRREVPHVTISTTWFFYRQALLREWIHLGLSQAAGDVLWMTIALPLVPVVRVVKNLM